MIRDDTRQTIKFLFWVLGLIVITYIASIIIFFRAGTTSRTNEREIAQIAQSKTSITNIQKYYHLDRGVNSYSLMGTNKQGKTYYFIYLPKSKHAYIYSSQKGTNENKIKTTFNNTHQDQKISAVTLGWYQGNPVWEITSQNSNNQYSYTLYDFKNGKEVNEVANL